MTPSDGKPGVTADRAGSHFPVTGRILVPPDGPPDVPVDESETPAAPAVPSRPPPSKAMMLGSSAATRRAKLIEVRVAVRSQLAASQRHRREEVALALVSIRRGLQGLRSDVHSRLRDIGLQASQRRSSRKLPVTKS